MSRSVLLVSYFFPPARDTGARRPAAMAKYLSRLGHRVTVLSTKAFGSEPHGVEGVELIQAHDLQHLRARLSGADSVGSLFDSDSYSGKPHPVSYVVVPEPLNLAWAPFARRAALAAHREIGFDVVLTTSPPESAHRIGKALGSRGVPWVADVRDAWTFEPLRPRFPLAAQRRLDARLERSWLGAADRVVCVSEPAAADLRSRRIADPDVIHNAWDPEDDPAPEAVADAAAELDAARVSLIYTGRFGSYGRDPGALVRALRDLAAKDPDRAGRLEVVIAGPLTPDERRLFESDCEPVALKLLGSVERERALALQRAADGLLLVAQPTRSQLANFKLFEYIAAARPILALAAGTEAGRLVAEVCGGETVRADDPGAIVTALQALIDGRVGPPEERARRRFSYPAAAEAMAETLASAVSARANPQG